MTDTPLIRVMALHALVYCERLFFLEEVEEIRKADANVYAGRRLHDSLEKGSEIFTLELESENFGIRGKVDCVRRESGRLIVYEHKRGRSKDGIEAWPADRLQVLAYSLLIADHEGTIPDEARIKYHADNKLIKIKIDPIEVENQVRSAVARANELRGYVTRPPVSVPEQLCRKCSLSPVCLPEEERFAKHEKTKIERLFPANDDRQIIHVVEQGSSARKDGEQIVINSPEGSKRAFPGKSVSALIFHGNIQVSTQVVHFCAANDIGLHWISYGGHYVGGLSAGAGGVQRRVRQYQAFSNPAFRADLALRLSLAKIENQLRYILRATRDDRKTGSSNDVQTGIISIRSEIKALARLRGQIKDSDPENPDNDLPAIVGKVRGHEGLAGRYYFTLLSKIIRLDGSDLFNFDNRNRRPPRDPFNALLSFGYALLYRDCVAAIMAVGLEPSLGFFHTPRSAAYPLALDLMELFRVFLWDIPMIGSINRQQWCREDFQITKSQVWLNSNGRKRAIQIYENRKNEKWKHPILNYSLSYGRTIELEAKLLEKEWTGKDGLFAKMRLR